MTTTREREADDSYERQNDRSPVPGDYHDNSYVFGTRGQRSQEAPVQADEDDYDVPFQAPESNSDQQLAEDENSLDSSNILKGDRLRHAKPQTQNRYNEHTDEDDLPREVADGSVGVSGTRRVT